MIWRYWSHLSININVNSDLYALLCCFKPLGSKFYNPFPNIFYSCIAFEFWIRFYIYEKYWVGRGQPGFLTVEKLWVRGNVIYFSYLEDCSYIKPEKMDCKLRFITLLTLRLESHLIKIEQRRPLNMALS